ncbi:MAG TPA: SIMPL domain-containing protein [Myxococcota bacterium]|jgi:hypothetical protein
MPVRLSSLALVAVAASAPALAVTALRTAPTVLTASTITQPRPEPDRAITISGDAKIDVVPDQASIHLAVDIVNQPSAALAMKQAAERSKKILAAAQALGVSPVHIKTEEVTVSAAQRTRKDGSLEVTGYNASRAIVVCVTDLKTVDAVVDALVKAGANRLDQIAFDTSDLDKRRGEARLLAVRAAKQKAELIAKELGVHLGKPRTVSEGAFGWSGAYVVKNVEESVQTGAFVDGAFAPGQITVNMQVSVIFDLDT